MGGLFAAVRYVPGLGRWSDDMRPIPLTVLSRAFLRVLEAPKDGETLTGRDLWSLGASPA